MGTIHGILLLGRQTEQNDRQISTGWSISQTEATYIGRLIIFLCSTSLQNLSLEEGD